MGVISIRPTEEMEKKLEELMRLKKMERSALIRQLLDRGIKDELIEHGLNLFRKRKVSLGKAAEIAGISIREMHELIKEGDIPLHISREDLKKDYEAASR